MNKLKSVKNIIRLSAVALLVVAFGCMFFNQVIVTNQGKLNFIESYFSNHGSFIPLIGYVLLFLTAFGITITVFFNQYEEKRIVFILCAIIILISSIIIFMEGALITIRINTEGVSARLLTAPIVAGSLSILASLGICFAEFIPDIKL